MSWWMWWCSLWLRSWRKSVRLLRLWSSRCWLIRSWGCGEQCLRYSMTNPISKTTTKNRTSQSSTAALFGLSFGQSAPPSTPNSEDLSTSTLKKSAMVKSTTSKNSTTVKSSPAAWTEAPASIMFTSRLGISRTRVRRSSSKRIRGSRGTTSPTKRTLTSSRKTPLCKILLLPLWIRSATPTSKNTVLMRIFPRLLLVPPVQARLNTFRMCCWISCRERSTTLLRLVSPPKPTATKCKTLSMVNSIRSDRVSSVHVWAWKLLSLSMT